MAHVRLWFAILLTTTLAAQDPPIVLRGRIVDEQGLGIAGAAVASVPRTQFVDTSDLLKNAENRTDEQGNYQLELTSPKTSSQLILAARNHQSCAIRIVPDHERSRAFPRETVLPKSGQLIGRVRDEDGKQLEGVRIDVTDAIKAPWTAKATIRAGSISNKKGIFVVPGVPRTGLLMTARCDGFVPIERIVAQGSPLTLTMVRAARVRGQVLGSDGKPVAEASVRILTAVRGNASPEPVTSDDNGQFAIDVPRGVRYALTAYKRDGERRNFRSKLLRGSHDDVRVEETEPQQESSQQLQLTVLDKQTKKPLQQYTVAELNFPPTNLLTALFHADHATANPNKKTITVKNGRPRGLLFRAPGHAFEAITTPDSFDEPLVVELGPEAVLTGIVTDGETGKPMAGVKVRALPKGNVSGGGGMPSDAWPTTGADGRYRIAGLQPGDYGVQAHHEQRRASPPQFVAVAVAEDATLALEVPARKTLHLDITGTIPPGPTPALEPGDNFNYGSGTGSFTHSLAPPQPMPLRLGKLAFGPVATTRLDLNVFVPSRTRVGSGTLLSLGAMDFQEDRNAIALPDLTSTIVRGRIECDSKLPTERIAVLAHVAGKQQRSGSRARPCLAGLFVDGSFVMDLPTGTYCLQLLDVATGIVFHTSEDLTIGKDPIVLKPQIHWLDIRCEPSKQGDPVAVHSFGVTLDRPRGGDFGAFLKSWSGSSRRESGTIDCKADSSEQRWLVPAGTIRITARSSYSRLARNSSGMRQQDLDSESIEIERTAHEVRLEIPAPPTDEELDKQ